MTKQERETERAKRMARHVEAQRITAHGMCPDCGTKLYRNLALSGWWQCGRRGAPGFQKEAGPACDFQLFYDPTPAEHAAIIGGGQ